MTPATAKGVAAELRRLARMMRAQARKDHLAADRLNELGPDATRPRIAGNLSSHWAGVLTGRAARLARPKAKGSGRA